VDNTAAVAKATISSNGEIMLVYEGDSLTFVNETLLEKMENTGDVVGEQQEDDKHQTDEVNKDDKEKVN